MCAGYVAGRGGHSIIHEHLGSTAKGIAWNSLPLYCRNVLLQISTGVNFGCVRLRPRSSVPLPRNSTLEVPEWKLIRKLRMRN